MFFNRISTILVLRVELSLGTSGLGNWAPEAGGISDPGLQAIGSVARKVLASLGDSRQVNHYGRSWTANGPRQILPGLQVIRS